MKEAVIINTIYFLSSYILMLLIYILFINRRRKTYKEGKKAPEIDYIIKKFKLDPNTNYKKLKWIITFINPLIISLTFIVVINIKSFTLGILVGFVIMVGLVYSLYEIIGRILKKRGNKNV